MAGIGTFFLFCVVGVIIVSAILWGETFILNALPNGTAKEQVISNLVIPLEVMVILFAIGAVVSIFLWFKSSSSQDYY